jgi:hypothetical protein
MIQHEKFVQLRHTLHHETRRECLVPRNVGFVNQPKVHSVRSLVREQYDVSDMTGVYLHKEDGISAERKQSVSLMRPPRPAH